MDTEYILTADGELYHWGIKGMKWGFRRYQNKDGSLTPAGKKKYAKEMAKIKEREAEIKGREKARARQAKIDSKKAELDAREEALKNPKKAAAMQKAKDGASKPSGIKDMSDDELRALTNRMQLEKNYIDAQTNLAKVNPKHVSTGEKIVNYLKNDLVDDVIIPVAKEQGKAWLSKKTKEALGLKEEKNLSWDDMTKKQTWEKNERNKPYEDLQREWNILEQQVKNEQKRKELEALRSSNNPQSQTRSGKKNKNKGGS